MLIRMEHLPDNVAVAWRVPYLDGPQPVPQMLPPVQPSLIVPDRCCLYCGVALASEGAGRMANCPACGAENRTDDIALHGHVDARHTMTAGRVTVDAQAQIKGNIIAAHARIAGCVYGDVMVCYSCIIEKGGKVHGRIICRNLRIEPGAQVCGEIERLVA
jgi:hypothetical protein